MNSWVADIKNDKLSLKLKTTKESTTLAEEDILVRHHAFAVCEDDMFYKRNVSQIPIEYRSREDFIFGITAGGYVESIGENVPGFETGDRVVYPFAPFGAYCEKRSIDYKYCIKVPKEADFDRVIAFTRDAMKATMFLYTVLTLQDGDFILIHDVCKPVGRFMAQLAKRHKLKVVGTILTDDDYSKALSLNIDLIVNLKTQDLFKEVNIFSEGIGIRVVYDFLGKEVFDISKRVMRPFGIYVSCDYKTGELSSINPLEFRKKNLFFTAPTLELYNMNRYALILNATEVFELISTGVIDNKIMKYGFNSVDKLYQDFESNNYNESVLVRL